jgi:4-amino-4-deoxy-L-arabinose transferase-like glycosyltransferase
MPSGRRANAILLTLSAAYFLLLWVPGSFGSGGYFIDEFYYLACADHLAFGYVDHPSLSIAVLWAVRKLFGDALPVLRFFPALAGAAAIFLVGILARRLGAGPFGQAVAAGAAMAGSIWQIFFSVFSMNCFEILIWEACFLVLIEIERLDRPRLWLAFGALAGLGLENKHTMVLFAAGLTAGLALTRARRHLAQRWIWLGLGLAVLLFLPNLLWQAAHGWPSLEFYRNADQFKNVPTPPLEALKQQVLFMNPGALPVWLAGLVFLLWRREGRPYRHLGWLFLALFALMVFGGKSRPDRITAAYPIVFAAGGALLGLAAARGPWRWLKGALPACIALGGAVTLPLSVMILPPQSTAEYGAALGIVPQIEQGTDKASALPQWLADRFGWEQLAADVEKAAASLAPEERARAIVLAPSYGQAGSIALLGRGLPPVYGGQNSYWHWGPPPDPAPAAVLVGYREETARWLYDDVTLALTHDCQWCMPWRDSRPIWVCRGPKLPFAEVWPEFRHYE